MLFSNVPGHARAEARHRELVPVSSGVVLQLWRRVNSTIWPADSEKDQRDSERDLNYSLWPVPLVMASASLCTQVICNAMRCFISSWGAGC